VRADAAELVVEVLAAGELAVVVVVVLVLVDFVVAGDDLVAGDGEVFAGL